MKLAICFNHTPWVADRAKALRGMLIEIAPLACGIPYWIHDTDYRDRPWQLGGKLAWMCAQWEWALSTTGEQAHATHVMFCTDDLHLVPRFVDVVSALVEAVPDFPIGLLSNHPKAPELAAESWRVYATNSWITGPGMILPRHMLRSFYEWFSQLPMSSKLGPESWNEDSVINQWITSHGPGRTIHTLPGLIEHRGDLKSTVGHGDRYSRERLSWRSRRSVRDLEGDGGGFYWAEEPHKSDIDAMTRVEFWNERGGAPAAPLLPVGD
jgi:hypothetical protein